MKSIYEANSDPPGIENNETSDLQLNHTHPESTDDEKLTENKISIKM